MRFRIQALEERIVYDAGLAAVVAEAVDHQSSEDTNNEDGGLENGALVEAAAEVEEAPVQVLMVSSAIDGHQFLANAATANVIVVSYDPTDSLDTIAEKMRTFAPFGLL